MSTTTPNLKLPKPALADAPNGPVQIGALADKLESLFGQVKALSIPGAESTTSTSDVFLTTHDVISGVVVPTDALVEIYYTALWKGAGAGGTYSEATLYFGSSPLAFYWPDGTKHIQFAQHEAASGKYGFLTTSANGLVSSWQDTADATDLTAGQPTMMGLGIADVAGSQPAYGGGPITVLVTPGTYDIGVKFSCASGVTSTTVKNRRLFVRVKPFGG